MKTILRHSGIGGLLFAQTQVAFNDNATKLILIGLVQLLLPAEGAARLVGLIALLLVTPFVLFAPVSGWLADRFPKRAVLSASLWMQLVVMALLIGATLIQSIPLAIGGFFLLGLQSALMSPARRGMVKELAGNSVGEVVGWMEMLCIAAILAGSLAGGQLIDGLTPVFQGPWSAALASFGLLAASGVVALWYFRKVPSHPAKIASPFGTKVVFGHMTLLKTLRKDRALWRAALGDAAFYLAGGLLMLMLSQVGRTLHPDGLGAARSTGIMLAVMGSGIAAGSIFTARLCRDRINLGLVPAAALGMAVISASLAAIQPGTALFLGALFTLGLCGGLFLVPLGAFLVDRAPEAERGTILAASSMLSSIAGIVAVAVYYLLTEVIGLGVGGQFLVIAAGLLVTAILALKMLPQDFLRTVTLLLSRIRYSVRSNGTQHLPQEGGALIVCNHVSYVDTIILSIASPRPIRFLSYETFFSTPILGSILRLFGAIPVSPNRAKEAILLAAEHVRNGELVCIFPEGQLTRTGSLMELKSGFELIARRADCPVLVAHLDGLWGSIHSFEGGRYFTKLPRGLRRKTTVSFAAPLTAREATALYVRKIMLELGEATFRQRPEQTLDRSVVDALGEEPFRICLADPSMTPAPLNSAKVLAASWALAAQWKISIPERRVGVMLPPGVAGTLANLGLILAGKVPVNLNPTLSEEAASACLRQAGVNTVITVAEIESRFGKFPWPNHVLLFDHELQKIPASTRNARFAAAATLPTAVLKSMICRKETDLEDEAVLLFTSGTSGLPKGVALTHRNIMANIRQVAETGFLRADDRLLTGLPLFHSFGLTMGLFFPMIAGRTIVSVPSPLDCDKIADAARSECPTVLLSTPTFLRQYTKRISRDAFGTLRLVVTGAEKLPEDVHSAFRARFGCDVLEGYGLTEAAPVVCLNIPHPARGLGADSLQRGFQGGSVGRLLPGIAFRVHDPETLAETGSSGMLALRGANIVDGYLENQSPEKFRDGWYFTGDIVRVDHEGFVIIEGRSSRFSKLGGEMVSHAAVEAALASALPDRNDAHCIIGRPHAEKGEELVLLTTGDLTRDEVREALKSHVPNLWIPRVVLKIEALPMLASGKLDLAACRKCAETIHSN